MANNKIYKDIELIDSFLRRGEPVNRDLLIVALYLAREKEEIKKEGDTIYYPLREAYLPLNEYVKEIDPPIPYTYYDHNKNEISKYDYDLLPPSEQVLYKEKKSKNKDLEIIGYVKKKKDIKSEKEFNELKPEEKIFYKKKKINKPNTLSNSLKHTWDKIKEIIAQKGYDPNKVCEIKTESKGIKKKDKITYYRYLLPEFTILPLLNEVKEEENNTKYFNALDKFVGGGGNIKDLTQQRKELISHLDEIYKNSIKDILVELEDEICDSRNGENYLDGNDKFLTALEYALIRVDTLKLASMLKEYMDKCGFVNDIETNCDDDRTSSTRNSHRLINRCLNIILAHTEIKIESLKDYINNKEDKNIHLSIRRCFESQICMLKEENASSLADIIYVYGQFLHRNGWFEDAIKYFGECRDIYLKSFNSASFDIEGHKNLALVYSALAVSYQALAVYPKAYENCMKGIELYEKLFQERPNANANIVLASLCNNLGSIQTMMKLFDSADKTYAKALKLLSEIPSQSDDNKVEDLYVITLMNRLENIELCDNCSIFTDIVEKKFELSVANLPSVHDLEEMIFVCYAQSNVLINRDEYDLAMESSTKALEASIHICEISKKYTLLLTTVLTQISKIYDRKGDYQNAYKALCYAFDINSKPDVQTLPGVRAKATNLVFEIVQILLKINDFSKAIEFCELIYGEYERMVKYDFSIYLNMAVTLHCWALALKGLGDNQRGFFSHVNRRNYRNEAIKKMTDALFMLNKVKNIGDDYKTLHELFMKDLESLSDS